MNRPLFSVVALSVALMLTPAMGQHKKRDSVLSYVPKSTGTPTIPAKYRVTSMEQLIRRTAQLHVCIAQLGENVADR